ncbi:hypothetical protein IQK56_07370 [Pseudomonas sp. MAFF 301449]|uniref:Uncharacterized protein n=1 Tax=Pseudomonas cyclaminis TaxID=2781239 RepID=A0ABR9SP98_9PSED|nr:hypothetical protein [Pseudomonas cyclaminis]MBE8590765.1 hypothetical protein [Pseudomonas cyclaminis]MBE8598706.1 hypothetical protein [Pseudomonas cyclaminis]
MTISELKRKLGLPFNQNPSLEEMRAHGVEPPRRPLIAPKAPPPVPRG